MTKTIQIKTNKLQSKCRFKSLSGFYNRERIFLQETVHHDLDTANQKQSSCKPNDQENSSKLKIRRASLMLKQSESFPSQKKRKEKEKSSY